jgi:carbonyl reductase 1
MTNGRTALVTGANQGIGRAVVEGLAARLTPTDLVLLTGRDPGRVARAADEVARASAGGARVVGRVLDVSDAAAVAELAAELGTVDIVVSNAAARLDPAVSQAAQADGFVAVANGGTHAVLRSFAPVLRPGGRLVVVASSLGTLGHLDPRLRHRFDGVTLGEVEKAIAEWLDAVHDGTAARAGWSPWINVPSKVAQVAAVRAVAAERRVHDLADGILIAAVCPGLVDTAASRPWFDDFSAARTPAEAADPIVDLVLAATTDPAFHGELVRYGAVVRWGAGSPVHPQDATVLP